MPIHQRPLRRLTRPWTTTPTASSTNHPGTHWVSPPANQRINLNRSRHGVEISTTTKRSGSSTRTNSTRAIPASPAENTSPPAAPCSSTMRSWATRGTCNYTKEPGRYTRPAESRRRDFEAANDAGFNTMRPPKREKTPACKKGGGRDDTALGADGTAR